MLKELHILDRTISTFEIQSKELMTRISNIDLSDMGQRRTLKQQVHALKGVCFNSGAQHMGRLCDSLEICSLDCGADTAADLIQQMEMNLQHTLSRFHKMSAP